jgi:epoxyqueuosine reductase
MSISTEQLETLAHRIPKWAKEYGFEHAGITEPEPGTHGKYLKRWLKRGDHGSMKWMASNEAVRLDPKRLHPPTQRIIVCRMNYLQERDEHTEACHERATVSRYARGRDYHKLMRTRLRRMAQRIEAEIAPHQYRVACDSAPVMERALGSAAGLGWIGKNTMLIDKQAGSWFFLGVLLTDLPLPVNQEKIADYCGECEACISGCPTQAFRGPYQLDARRCISYLTIENHGSIPEHFRKAIGNRVFGCDECQRVCPWNHKYQSTSEPDFSPRHNLDSIELCELFMWSEQEYMRRSEGMAIRRCGYLGWLRNIAVGLGNAPGDVRVIESLKARSQHESVMVREHVHWALAQHGQPLSLS